MRNLRKKYKNPKRPWDSVRVEEERKILGEYGLRRKREIWRAEGIVREFRRRARNLIARKDEKMAKTLLNRLTDMGMLQKDQTLENVLTLNVNHVLSRRLQTLVFKKGFANSAKHARQLITHGHVSVDGRRIMYPSYLVSVDKEDKIKLSEDFAKRADLKEGG